jgi:hypothetical protein
VPIVSLSALRRSVVLPGVFVMLWSVQGWAQGPQADAVSSSVSSSEGLLASFESSSVAESAVPTAPMPMRTAKPKVETTVSVGGFSQLTATRITTPLNNFNTESMTPSGGVLGTFRQSFKPWLGYAVSFGFTRAEEHYTQDAGFYSFGTGNDQRVAANMYEFTLSYVAEKHLTRKLSGFADVGAGMIAFQPVNAGDAVNNYRAAGVGGIGVDYDLGHRFGLRAEYRGQLYKFADYGDRFAKTYTVTSEPTLSLVYRFGKGRP